MQITTVKHSQQAESIFQQTFAFLNTLDKDLLNFFQSIIRAIGDAFLTNTKKEGTKLKSYECEHHFEIDHEKLNFVINNMIVNVQGKKQEIPTATYSTLINKVTADLSSNGILPLSAFQSAYEAFGNELSEDTCIQLLYNSDCAPTSKDQKQKAAMIFSKIEQMSHEAFIATLQKQDNMTLSELETAGRRYVDMSWVLCNYLISGVQSIEKISFQGFSKNTLVRTIYNLIGKGTKISHKLILQCVQCVLKEFSQDEISSHLKGWIEQSRQNLNLDALKYFLDAAASINTKTLEMVINHLNDWLSHTINNTTYSKEKNHTKAVNFVRDAEGYIAMLKSKMLPIVS